MKLRLGQLKVSLDFKISLLKLGLYLQIFDSLTLVASRLIS